jgi:hypothetical protein
MSNGSPYRFGVLMVIRWMTLLIACTAQMVAQSGGNLKCKGLHDSDTPAAALAYLSGNRDALNSGCITRALYIIGRAGYKPAASTLIGYLDFEDPAILAGSKMVRQGGVYPAEAALESLGASSIPYLKRAIANQADTNILRRVNASATLFFVAESKPEALAFIIEKAHGSQDAEVAKALIGVVGKLLRFCRPKDANEGQYVWASR